MRLTPFNYYFNTFPEPRFVKTFHHLSLHQGRKKWIIVRFFFTNYWFFGEMLVYLRNNNCHDDNGHYYIQEKQPSFYENRETNG